MVAFTDDKQIMKNPALRGINNLGLWDVKRKPPPRANGPPIESFIIYDESSSPGADGYIIDADYLIETYIKKNPVAAALVNYTQIGLNFQFI